MQKIESLISHMGSQILLTARLSYIMMVTNSRISLLAITDTVNIKTPHAFSERTSLINFFAKNHFLSVNDKQNNERRAQATCGQP